MKLNKKFKESSKRWLIRQLNDPYVKKAKQEGYRSRAAFKLIEINKKERLIKQGMNVLDLGAAPGGWLQVTSKIIGDKGSIIGIDLLPIEPIDNRVTLIQGSFLDNEISSKFHVVLSDMAPSSCGIQSVDQLRIVSLLDDVIEKLPNWLLKDGSFVAKVLQGGTDPTLLKKLKIMFKSVSHFKPSSSRSESSEMYVVAKGFKA